VIALNVCRATLFKQFPPAGNNAGLFVRFVPDPEEFSVRFYAENESELGRINIAGMWTTDGGLQNTAEKLW
jgi:hypothetical protein